MLVQSAVQISYMPNTTARSPSLFMAYETMCLSFCMFRERHGWMDGYRGLWIASHPIDGVYMIDWPQGLQRGGGVNPSAPHPAMPAAAAGTLESHDGVPNQRTPFGSCTFTSFLFLLCRPGADIAAPCERTTSEDKRRQARGRKVHSPECRLFDPLIHLRPSPLPSPSHQRHQCTNSAAM